MNPAPFLLPEAFSAPPDMATTVACRVVRVVDGDTVEVAVEQVYRVRLQDCWAPEVRGEQKEFGLASQKHLREYIAETGIHGVLSVPWSVEIGKSWSLGRVLGKVWLDGQEKSLSEIQVEAGHASKEKP